MRFKKEKFIRQRYSEKTDSWTFQVRVGKAVKSFNEETYGSARSAYQNAIWYRNQLVAKIADGAYSYTNNVSLEQVFDETFEMLPVREETKRKHLILFKKHFPAKRGITTITRSDVIKCLNSMISTCTDDTIGRVLSIWRRIFKTAIAEGYTNVDLTVGIVPPKSQVIKTSRKVVTTTREILDEVENRIKHTFCESEAKSVCTALEVMWYVGLRPAECFALTKDDIKNGYITINKELGSSIATKGELDKTKINVIRRCKTEASIRTIPIPDKLQQILDDYEVEGDKLFPDRYGNYFVVDVLGQKIHLLGVPFNMYQLRHTVATRLVTANVDERTIIEILGHEHIDMSVYYARSNDDLKKNALNNT